MPAVSHANDFRWNAKIHAGKKPFLAGGWRGGEGGYKACCNLHLATLVPEVVLDFSPRKKEHLPASFAIRSRRFARLQHLTTNISVIMYETVSPWYIFCTPTTVIYIMKWTQPFSRFSDLLFLPRPLVNRSFEKKNTKYFGKTHGILKERKSVLLVCLLLYWEESYTIASTA